MPYGSLSTFPNTLDQFAVKVPGLIEDANHINHYNDAIIQLERYLIDKLGGGIVSSNVSGLIYGDNLLIGTATFTTTTTSLSNTLSVSGTIPAAFGSDPLSDLGFVAIPTVYVTQAGMATGGIWANQNWSDPQPLNEMLTWCQHYALLKPLTGNNFEVSIVPKVYSSSSNWVGSGLFTDLFNRGNSLNLGNAWVVLKYYSPSHAFSILSSSLRVTPVGVNAVTYPKFFDSPGVTASMRNQEMIFELAKFSERQRGGTQWNRGGPVVRGCYYSTGQDYHLEQYLRSGYILSFADHDTSYSTNPYATVKLLKLPAGSDGQVFANYSVLASSTTFRTTANCGSAVYYSLSAIDAGGGAVITVKQRIASGGWSTVMTYTDTSTPLTSGFAGFTSCYDSSTGPSLVNQDLYYDNLTIQQPTASGSPLQIASVDVRMLYVKINDSLRTMGNNW